MNKVKQIYIVIVDLGKDMVEDVRFDFNQFNTEREVVSFVSGLSNGKVRKIISVNQDAMIEEKTIAFKNGKLKLIDVPSMLVVDKKLSDDEMGEMIKDLSEAPLVLTTFPTQTEIGLPPLNTDDENGVFGSGQIILDENEGLKEPLSPMKSYNEEDEDKPSTFSTFLND
jgi:hypothetical protein